MPEDVKQSTKVAVAITRKTADRMAKALLWFAVLLSTNLWVFEEFQNVYNFRTVIYGTKSTLAIYFGIILFSKY